MENVKNVNKDLLLQKINKFAILTVKQVKDGQLLQVHAHWIQLIIVKL